MSGLLFICRISEALLVRLGSPASSSLAASVCQAARAITEVSRVPVTGARGTK